MLARRVLRASKLGIKSLVRPMLAAWDGPGRTLSPAQWRLSAIAGQGLALGRVPLHALLAEWGSPLFVVDAAQLRANARAFLQAPPGRERGCEVYYSYKTNPVEGVLRLLHAHGVGAEVISPYELWLARRLGVPPERIIYNGPAKSDESLRDAVELGISSINCNHREEIARISEIAQQLGRRARVGLRVTTGDTWSAQFGTPIAGGQALKAFAEAKAAPMLDVVSVHAHRGGMLRGEPELTDFVSSVLSFVEELDRELGMRVEQLNFGGSLGLDTVSSLGERDRRLNQTFQRALPAPAPNPLSIARYVERISTLAQEHFERASKPCPRLLLEPGRSMTGNTQLLLTRVVTIKDSPELRYAVLDAGINIAESVRSEFHQVFPVNRFGEPNDRVHRLVGPICSPGDTLYSAIRLPALAPGDSLAIMDAGAYFVPFSTSFSFPQPAIVLVDGERVSLLRRREQFEDMVSYEQPLDTEGL